MMKLTSLGIALSLILIGCGQESQNDKQEVSANTLEAKADKNKENIGITLSGLTDSIKTLASDEFGGRAPGTQGEVLTVNYLINQFKAMGLAPANGDKYTQAVPLTSVEATNQPLLTFSDGVGADLILSYPAQQVVWTRQQVEQSSIIDSELVFVGYGINAPERNWNDYAEVDVKGKTVVMLVNDPGYATQNPELFNGNAMTYYGRWDYKFDEAARQGAAGAIIIHDTKPAAYPWSTVSASWTGAQFDLVRPDKGENLSAVEGWIHKEQAAELFSKAGMDLKAMYLAAQTPGFKARPMKLTASTEINNKISTVNSQNVAAMVKGSESPDDVFIYMAHWDHIGTDPSIEGDGIYNGAKDNATGTAGLLEIAKAYANLPQPPKRSVMFLAVTAEEQGLLGSAYYAANPIYPLAKTIAGLNMDGLTNFGRARDVTLIGKGNSQLDAYLIKQAKNQDRVIVADPKPEKGSFYRSDHFELSKQGVPMLYPKPGYDHREKGFEYGLKKAAEYVSTNYHRPSDEYNSSWDLTGAVEDLELYFATGLDIVNSGDWPEWTEGTEFKAAREKQRKN